MQTVLTIAGFDPSSGAGVTADLMTFAAHGLFGTSAITALTVQSTLGVEASHPVEPGILRATLDCLGRDIRPSGVKIGMVASSSNASVISAWVGSLKTIHPETIVVLDPVLVASSGRSLLSGEGLATVRQQLLQWIDWVTPNTDELEALTAGSVQTKADMAAGAAELQKLVGTRPDGSKIGVFAKGGHLEQPDDLLLLPDGREHWLPGERIETSATHGTGCALSSAFLSRLVLGDDSMTAAQRAKDYVAEAMRQAPGVGKGKGPMWLLWPLRAQHL